MKFEFKPLSDEELKAPMYPAGIYSFRVKSANIGFSKSSGNPMITVFLEIKEEGKQPITIKDYLVETMMWKLSTFCKSIGKDGLYKNGSIEESQIINSEGFADFIYEKSDKDGKEYLKVKNYIKKESENASPDDEFLNDDINF